MKKRLNWEFKKQFRVLKCYLLWLDSWVSYYYCFWKMRKNIKFTNHLSLRCKRRVLLLQVFRFFLRAVFDTYLKMMLFSKNFKSISKEDLENILLRSTLNFVLLSGGITKSDFSRKNTWFRYKTTRRQRTSKKRTRPWSQHIFLPTQLSNMI